LSLTKPPEEKNPERLLSPEELARTLALGRTTVYTLLRQGDIPSLRIGRLRRIKESDVRKFVAGRLEHGGG